MKVVDLNRYRLRRQLRLNDGHTMTFGNRAPGSELVPGSVAPTAGPDRIRMDCLQRYVKAQLSPRSTK